MYIHTLMSRCSKLHPLVSSVCFFMLLSHIQYLVGASRKMQSNFNTGLLLPAKANRNRDSVKSYKLMNGLLLSAYPSKHTGTVSRAVHTECESGTPWEIHTKNT